MFFDYLVARIRTGIEAEPLVEIGRFISDSNRPTFADRPAEEQEN